MTFRRGSSRYVGVHKPMQKMYIRGMLNLFKSVGIKMNWKKAKMPDDMAIA
jgi:hypothetical protein